MPLNTHVRLSRCLLAHLGLHTISSRENAALIEAAKSRMRTLEVMRALLEKEKKMKKLIVSLVTESDVTDEMATII